MSMIGISLLNESVMVHKLIHPEEILEELRNGVILSLKQNTVEDSNDGMDLSLIVWDKKTGELEFSGANNPLIVVRNGELIEIKGDKQPIGIYPGQPKPFTRNNFKTEPGDMLYLFTDGYADQFGGVYNKKFKTHKFKALLINIASNDVNSQKEKLNVEFENWKGNEEQLDDICVIGIKV
jgi:serine phosphatase RsbU (regulator of sigma subunit)